jgi:hypothetical protein
MSNSYSSKLSQYTSSLIDGIIDNTNLSIHAKLIGYSLYCLEDKDTNNMYYGMLYDDFINYFNKDNIETSGVGLIDGDDEAYMYIMFCSATIDNFTSMFLNNTNNFELYIFQRILFPNNDDIKSKPTKQLEYDICFQLIMKLNDILIFKHQTNILGYFADLMFEIKSNTFNNIPTICIEIDEDNHIDRDPEQEHARQAVLEYFVNKVIRIPVKRNASNTDITDIVDKYAEQIRNLFADLVYEHTAEITEEQFINTIDKYNTDKDFISYFFNNERTHNTIGDYLGYRAGNRNYAELRNLIKKKLKIDFDYETCCRVDPVAGLTNNSNRNLGGAGQNRIIYKLTRIGFYKLCIESSKPKAKRCLLCFVNVYSLTLEYTTQLRAKLIKNNTNITNTLPLIETRINERVEQRIKRIKIAKVEDKYIELVAYNDDLQQKYDALCIKFEKIEKSLYSIISSEQELQYEYDVLKEQYDTLQHQYNRQSLDVIHENTTELSENYKNVIKNINITKMKILAKIATIPKYSTYKKANKDDLSNKIIHKCDHNTNVATLVINAL